MLPRNGGVGPGSPHGDDEDVDKLAASATCDGVACVDQKQQQRRRKPSSKNVASDVVAVSTNKAKASAKTSGATISRKKAHSQNTKSNQEVQRQQCQATSVSPGPFPLYSTPSSVVPPSFSEGIASVVKLLSTKKNIVVLAGAGISTSSGIPDFRSKGTGLYETLDIHSLGLSCAEDLFCVEQFLHDPRPFYRFATNLYPAEGDVSPTPAHRFLALLNERGMLRRVYTQNIDGLEERAGVPSSKVVQTHGSLNWASCLKCRRKVDASSIMDDVRAGRVPKCRREKSGGTISKKTKISSVAVCDEMTSTAAAAGGGGGGGATCGAVPPPKSMPPPPPKRQRRQTSKLSDNGWSYADDGGDYRDEGVDSNDPSVCGGVLKPAITFFGETLSASVAKRLEKDREKADAVIVMGTSLSVAPMSKVIQYLSPSIPRILINRNIVKAPPQKIADNNGDDDEGEDDEEDTRGGYLFDACLLGFCDDVSRGLAKEMGRAEEKEDKDCAEEKKEAIKDESEHKLLCNVQDEYKGPNGTIRGLQNHPTDRIFLFPGAIIQTDGNDSDSDITYKEVARCDGCENEIQGSIMKCSQCFDFDLCATCYPKASRRHFEGKHTFVKEL